MPIDFTAASNEYVTLANESNFDFDRTDAFSISLWLKTSTAGTLFLFAKEKTDATFRGYDIRLGTGKIRFFLSSDNSGGPPDRLIVDGTSTINDGDWHHVLATTDGTGTFAGTAVYIDGVDEATVIDDSLTATILNDVTPEIGARQALFTYNGALSDVVVWSSEITPTEAAIICQSRLKFSALMFQQANVVGYWPMDDQPHGTATIGDTVRDFFGVNDGTSVNGGTWNAEEALSYQPHIMIPQSIAVAAAPTELIAERGPFRGINRGITRGVA